MCEDHHMVQQRVSIYAYLCVCVCGGGGHLCPRYLFVTALAFSACLCLWFGTSCSTATHSHLVYPPSI